MIAIATAASAAAILTGMPESSVSNLSSIVFLLLTTKRLSFANWRNAVSPEIIATFMSVTVAGLCRLRFSFKVTTTMQFVAIEP